MVSPPTCPNATQSRESNISPRTMTSNYRWGHRRSTAAPSAAEEGPAATTTATEQQEQRQRQQGSEEESLSPGNGADDDIDTIAAGFAAQDADGSGDGDAEESPPPSSKRSVSRSVWMGLGGRGRSPWFIRMFSHSIAIKRRGHRRQQRTRDGQLCCCRVF